MICEQVFQIDIRKRLKGSRKAAFNPVTGQYEALSITTTRTKFGEREWYACPHCERRCAILYARPRFACRICHRLSYSVERETIANRAITRAIRHREKYGLETGGTMAPFPSKPKWMRWHTYLKARATDKQLCKQAFGLSLAMLKR